CHVKIMSGVTRPLSFSEIELFNDRTISFYVFPHKVIEQTPPLADHLEKSSPGVVVLLVFLEVLVEMVNPFREDRDLHLRRAGVCLMQPVLFDYFRLFFLLHSYCLLFFLNAMSQVDGRSVRQPSPWLNIAL